MAELRNRFGAERVNTFLVAGGVSEDHVSLDVLADVLAAYQANEIDVQVQKAFVRRGADQVESSRYDKLLAALHLDLREGLLEALGESYGESSANFLAQEWSTIWVGWDSRKLDGSCGDPSDGAGLLQTLSTFDLNDESVRFSDSVLQAIINVVHRHVRLANIHRVVQHPSDEKRKEALRREGLTVGCGKIWRTNNCLSDSLLQLLMEFGVVHSSLDEEQRRAACLALREHLNLLPEDSMERPRDRDVMSGTDLGLKPDAFLQPDVHGASALRFFQRYFDEKGLLRTHLPPSGVRIVVRSRFDSEFLTPAFTIVCRSHGLSEKEKPWEFQLYNTTGTGISGTHFDPILNNSMASGSPVVSNESSSGGLLDGSVAGSPARRVRAKTSSVPQESVSSVGSAAAGAVIILDDDASAGACSTVSSLGARAAASGSAVVPVATVHGAAQSLRRSARVATRLDAAGRGQASRPNSRAKGKR